MEMLSMGDYGAYVWSSYFLTFIVVIISMIQGKRRHRRIEAVIRRTIQIKEGNE
jgi:heme exporter protein CcmD